MVSMRGVCVASKTSSVWSTPLRKEGRNRRGEGTDMRSLHLTTGFSEEQASV